MSADVSSRPSPTWSLERVPAVWLVVGGIVSVQFGAAIAKQLFPLVPPTAMVWPSATMPARADAASG